MRLRKYSATVQEFGRIQCGGLAENGDRMSSEMAYSRDRIAPAPDRNDFH